MFQTFRDRWVVNSPSVETLPQRKLDARIVHRFGDLAGDAGGWPTMYGLENASDVSLGFEYGFTNTLTFGAARSKGAGPLRQLVSGSMKWRLLSQRPGGAPFTVTLFGLSTVSTAGRSEDPSSINYFEVFQHRLVHHVSLLAARRLADRFSLQLSGGVTHRNVVPAGEVNDLFHAGVSWRWQVSRVLGIIGEASVPLNGAQAPFDRPEGNTYRVPLGLGFEFDTGGHVFQLNFTNATGILPTDYLPYTRTDWTEGQFRLGFTISRLFNL
ncbi:MAG: hypothetical protein RLY31_1371 [Bacteroidota bacterium]